MENKPEGRDIYFTKYDNLIPVESLLGLETPNKLSGGRGTGKTFRLMLLTLHAASANPGHWIRIVDHGFGNDTYLARRIKVFLEKSDMAPFFELTDSYSSDKLVRRYYIRFRIPAPNYKPSPHTF